MCLSIHPEQIHPYIYLPICPFKHSSLYLSLIHPLIHLSTHLEANLSSQSPIHPSTHLSSIHTYSSNSSRMSIYPLTHLPLHPSEILWPQPGWTGHTVDFETLMPHLKRGAGSWVTRKPLSSGMGVLVLQRLPRAWGKLLGPIN